MYVENFFRHHLDIHKIDKRFIIPRSDDILAFLLVKGSNKYTAKTHELFSLIWHSNYQCSHMIRQSPSIGDALYIGQYVPICIFSLALSIEQDKGEV